jgi:ABC-2 type transport system ATP-binding protein
VNTEFEVLQTPEEARAQASRTRPTPDLSKDGAAVWTQGLTRTFDTGKKKGGAARTVIAIAGIDLAIGRGELFGILGPNGAGKRPR